MSRFATHILIGFIALVAGVSAPVTAYIMRQPAVTPAPDEKPVVVDYVEQVRAACKDLDAVERDYVATQYNAIVQLCKCPKQPKDDGEYQKALESVRKAIYQDPYPFKESLATLTQVTVAEATKRGLLATNGEATPWDSEGWQSFADDTLMGVLP